MVGYNSQPRAGYNKLLSPRYSGACCILKHERGYSEKWAYQVAVGELDVVSHDWERPIADGSEETKLFLEIIEYHRASDKSTKAFLGLPTVSPVVD